MYPGEIYEIKQNIKSIDRLVDDVVRKSIKLTCKQAYDLIDRLIVKKIEYITYLKRLYEIKSNLKQEDLELFETYFEKRVKTADIATSLNISMRTLFRRLNKIKYYFDKENL